MTAIGNRRPLGALAAVFGLVLTIGCTPKEAPTDQFYRLNKSLPYNALALSPVRATALGYHEHVPGGPAGPAAELLETSDAPHDPLQSLGYPPFEPSATAVRLDELLDDYSSAGIQARIDLFTQVQDWLALKNEGASSAASGFERGNLILEQWLDYAVIETWVSRELHELQVNKRHEKDPVLYTELIGEALYFPLVREYADANTRYGHIVARLGNLPTLIQQAKGNLKSTSSVHASAALQQNAANIRLIRDVIPSGLPDGLQGNYDSASGAAVTALEDFGNFIRNDLDKSADASMGSSAFTAHFQVLGETDEAPGAIADSAQAAFDETRTKFISALEPMHRRIYGSGRPRSDRLLVDDVYYEVRTVRGGTGGFISTIKADLEKLQAFCTDKELIGPPPGIAVQVVETPQFLRSIFPAAGFLPPSALDSSSAAFLYVSPFPDGISSRDRTERLREYNQHKLALIAAREGNPGHFAQSAYSRQQTEDKPAYRVLLRAAAASAPFVDGWASYITETVVSNGYEAANKDFEINYLRDRLGLLADAIIDIKLHTGSMSAAEAKTFLVERALMSPSVADQRIRKAQLLPGAMSMHYLGETQWVAGKEHYQTEKQDYSYSSFHERALGAGPAPIDDISRMLATLQ